MHVAVFKNQTPLHHFFFPPVDCSFFQTLSHPASSCLSHYVHFSIEVQYAVLWIMAIEVLIAKVYSLWLRKSVNGLGVKVFHWYTRVWIWCQIVYELSGNPVLLQLKFSPPSLLFDLWIIIVNMSWLYLHGFDRIQPYHVAGAVAYKR